MSINYYKKGFSEDIIKDDGEWLKCITYFKYNSKTKKVYVTSIFTYNRKHIRIGVLNNNQGQLSVSNNGLRYITDDEVKDKVRKLIKKEPQLSISKLSEVSGYSTYRLNRVYMPVKRELL